MANILKLNISKKTITYADDGLVPGLQDELIRYICAGGKFNHLEKKCGGHPCVKTISNIAYGVTKTPRFITVLMLYKSLGFKIIATSE